MWFVQDNFAVQSFERGIAAKDSGAFAWEIVPVGQFINKLNNETLALCCIYY